MKKIKSSHDIDKNYAGKIVELKSDIYYFTGKRSEPIEYGYISPNKINWSSGEEGYSLKQLIRCDDVPGNCALVNSYIQKGNLYIKILPRNKLQKLRQMINSDKYYFCYSDKLESLKIIDDCSN